jgi:glyceraldehyde 3-phosphate dehydrogenase
MGIRIGINGFGRISRDVLRALLGRDMLDVVAVNDVTNARTLAHLLKYDSVCGILEADVQAEDNALVVNGKGIKVLVGREPANLPWKDLDVGIVAESTGKVTTGSVPPNTSRQVPHASSSRLRPRTRTSPLSSG